MKRMMAIFGALALAACSDRPSFSRETIDAHPFSGISGTDFLLGTATSAHQIEGGNENDWVDWENSSFPDGSPHIKDGTVSGSADESFTRFDTDLALMKELGANSYRFSIEWSRIEPEPGVFRQDVVDVYLDWVTKLRAAGITPMVTLFHFTLPRWVAAQGGWENKKTIADFEAYSRFVAGQLGGQVDLWCTLNEPNVYAVQGYIDGIWPPGKKSSKIAAQVLENLIEAHARSAQAVRAWDIVDADGDGKPTLIGIAHHVRVFEPASTSVLDTTVAGLTDDFFNASVLEAVRTGRIRLSVPGEIEIDRQVPDLKGSFDYLGLNYYTRDHVRADLGDPSLSNQYVPDDRPKNDLDWDIYPEGLYDFLVRFSAYGWPIYITENGIADNDGQDRPYYLRSHLYAVEQAAARGVDVRGYFHWSLIDNFEWAEGYAPRFGLYRVDFGSPEKTRIPTPAVQTFQDASTAQRTR